MGNRKMGINNVPLIIDCEAGEIILMGINKKSEDIINKKSEDIINPH